VVTALWSARGMEELSTCRMAPQGSLCHEKMRDLLMLIPASERPLPNVSLIQAQELYWKMGQFNCSRPCQLQEEPCVAYQADVQCYPHVTWASSNLKFHPDWYLELADDASLVDIAAYLYRGGYHGCKRPCQDGETLGNFVPAFTTTAEPSGTTTTSSTSMDIHEVCESAGFYKTTVPPTETATVPPTTVPPVTSTIITETATTLTTTSVTQTTATKTSTSTSTVTEDCFWEGWSFQNLVLGTTAEDAEACKAHCSEDAGAVYFVFEASGSCYCPGQGATPVQVASDFTSGRVNCGLGPHRSDVVAEEIEANLKSGCFVQDWAWAGLLTSEPVPVSNALKCQELLQNETSADNFVYMSSNGVCSLYKSQSNSASALSDVISGRKDCSNSSVDAIEVKEDVASGLTRFQAVGLQGSALAALAVAIVCGLAATLKAFHRGTGKDRSAMTVLQERSSSRRMIPLHPEVEGLISAI